MPSNHSASEHRALGSEPLEPFMLAGHGRHAAGVESLVAIDFDRITCVVVVGIWHSVQGIMGAASHLACYSQIWWLSPFSPRRGQDKTAHTVNIELRRPLPFLPTGYLHSNQYSGKSGTRGLSVAPTP